MKSKVFSLLHPFTPQAAGVVEKSVASYHSQPHLKAMKLLARKKNILCRMEYFTPGWRNYSFSIPEVEYVFYPVNFTWNGDHKKWKKQTSRSCLRAYKKNTPDVTIINMSGHSSPFSHQLAKVILKNNKNYIAMLGGRHYSDTPGNREYYRNAHHILVHTQLQKENMEKMEMFKNLDIRVFPLGVDCEVFRPGKQENTNPHLLFVGRIVELKRIHLIVEALKTLKNNGFPNAQLTIIGPVFSEKYLNRLNELILKLDLKNNVDFLGQKDHRELPAYFQQADLFCLPSTTESFGMVMTEAMACGVPVAAIKGAGGPDAVIDDGKNGLLARDETEYPTRILKFFQSENRQGYTRNARQTVLEKYSLEITYKALKTSVMTAAE